MKRDLELVRDILIVIEEQEYDCTANDISRSLSDKGNDTLHRSSSLKHHLEIMTQADLIDCEIRQFFGGNWTTNGPVKITWNGHEYLNSVRDNGIWEKVKKKIGSDKLQSVPLKVIQSVAITIIKDSLQ